jgi:hypothetical protein
VWFTKSVVRWIQVARFAMSDCEEGHLGCTNHHIKLKITDVFDFAGMWKILPEKKILILHNPSSLAISTKITNTLTFSSSSLTSGNVFYRCIQTCQRTYAVYWSKLIDYSSSTKWILILYTKDRRFPLYRGLQDTV